MVLLRLNFCIFKYVYFNEFQIEMIVEEKRYEYQKELVIKINEDVRERLKGFKGDNEEKK